MRPFRLEYKGPLHSSQAKKVDRRKEIHDIRRAFHRQLVRPWKSTELLRMRSQGNFASILQVQRGQKSDVWVRLNNSALPYQPRLDPDWAYTKRTKNGHALNFIPLVIRATQMALTCELIIHVSWRETNQGGILEETPEGFDLDNRLKGIMDALTIPQDNQLPDDISSNDPSPYFLILTEDDGLVTRIDIRADPIGLAPRGDEPEAYLEVDIQATIHSDALEDF